MMSSEVLEPQHGLTIWKTSVFIVGEIAGSGVLALPKAVDDSGWIGLVLIVICAFASAYTGAILGRAWLIVQNRNPQYQSHVVDPYPIIGEEAFGKFGRYLVSFSINFTLFGVATVFLILAAENIEDMISHATSDISFCYWIIILAVVLMPFVCLGTPKDFWAIAVGATVATACACVLLLIRISEDHGKVSPVIHSKQKFFSFFTAFGTIVFAFGGHPAFPTFQADMRNKAEFKWAVLLGYMIVMAMYLPTSTAAYFVYGNTVNDNILKTTTDGPITYIVQTLITLHLLFGFVIVINPFCQEIESKFGVPKEFTWKRCVARPVMVLAVLFVAESIPRFGAILSLVGGSTTTLLAYICPSVFYLKLCYKKPDDKVPFVSDELAEDSGQTVQLTRHSPLAVPLWEKILNYEIICIGLVAGIASTASAIQAIASPDSFTAPCYVNPNKAA